jgi:hypothetical protein
MEARSGYNSSLYGGISNELKVDINKLKFSLTGASRSGVELVWFKFDSISGRKLETFGAIFEHLPPNMSIGLTKTREISLSTNWAVSQFPGLNRTLIWIKKEMWLK